jgi:Coenzyme PQQ synthesis protein D (PqqD)
MLTSFQIAPQILREVITGEVVIINMISGSYYSLTEVGTFVWEMIEQGFSPEAMVNALLLQYDAELDTIEPALTALITSLVTENLITSVVIVDGTESSNVTLNTELNIEVKKLFTAPILSKYDDMQELLLVDPIHDVDESGWPNLKQEVSV